MQWDKTNNSMDNLFQTDEESIKFNQTVIGLKKCNQIMIMNNILPHLKKNQANITQFKMCFYSKNVL